MYFYQLLDFVGIIAFLMRNGIPFDIPIHIPTLTSVGLYYSIIHHRGVQFMIAYDYFSFSA